MVCLHIIECMHSGASLSTHEFCFVFRQDLMCPRMFLSSLHLTKYGLEVLVLQP